MRAVTGVLEEVHAERVRQDLKWGQRNYRDGTGPREFPLHLTAANLELRTGQDLAQIFRAKCGRNLPHEDNWRDILLEEVFEAVAEEDATQLRAELIQVAAVAAAWVEAIDRRAS